MSTSEWNDVTYEPLKKVTVKRQKISTYTTNQCKRMLKFNIMHHYNVQSSHPECIKVTHCHSHVLICSLISSQMIAVTKWNFVDWHTKLKMKVIKQKPLKLNIMREILRSKNIIGNGDLKNVIFWDVTQCGSCKNWRFGGTQHIHHQGDKNRWHSISSQHASVASYWKRCS
jgi:hypothetical protein